MIKKNLQSDAFMAAEKNMFLPSLIFVTIYLAVSILTFFLQGTYCLLNLLLLTVRFKEMLWFFWGQLYKSASP